MTANELYSLLVDLLETPKVGVYDEIRHTPHKPYYLVSVGGGRPIHDTLVSDGNHARTVFQVMAVNNNPHGCRLLAERAVNILDHLRPETGGWLVETVLAPTAPYPEDGPGEWRWSSTTEFAVHLRR